MPITKKPVKNATHAIADVEGIKHDNEPGFPKSYVRCTCGWKSKPYRSDSASVPGIIEFALGQYIDHRIDSLTVSHQEPK